MVNDTLEVILLSKRDHPLARILGYAAAPLYPLLHLGVISRTNLAARNRRRLPRPVISVGNLTVGGTGKTSFIRLLLSSLEEKGLKPAVLFRGYKRRGEGLVAVEAGLRPAISAQQCGDEPYMVAGWSKKSVVLVHADRYVAGLAAMDRYSPSLFLLDDGFQHVRLKRDLDIVLVDSTNPFDNGRLFPFGLLREPISALRRADITVLTRCNQSDLAPAIETVIDDIAPDMPVVRASHVPDSVLTSSGDLLEVGELKKKRVYAFSGLGNHSSFCLTVLECGASVSGFELFPDHHYYSVDEMDHLAREARSRGAEWLLTTEKDLVRIPETKHALPLHALTVRMEITAGKSELESKLGGILGYKLSL